MKKKLAQALLPAIALVAAQASADPSACLGCHAAEELEGADADAVREALADPGIPPHGPFAGLSLEEVQALLESLGE